MTSPSIRIQGKAPSILIVDDTPANLQILSEGLQKLGYKTRPVPSGKLALQAALTNPPDLVLLDITMPDMDGYEVCGRMKSQQTLRDIPVIFISAHDETMDKVKAFECGGVDYVMKPFQFEEVEARVATHLKLRAAAFDLERYNLLLQEMVKEQVNELVDSHLATIFAFAKLAERRDQETGEHILRVQRYCRSLATHLADEGVFLLDDNFIDQLFHACPLHDIGKVGIPDAILLKPGPLTKEEVVIMKQHAMLGAETLAAVVEKYPANPMIRMGMDVARSHHERWDGSGYPDGLEGEAIPLSARIMAIADIYDALRSARPYKPEFDHAKSFMIISEGDGRTLPAHFDPRILDGFRAVNSEFEETYAELRDEQPQGS